MPVLHNTFNLRRTFTTCLMLTFYSAIMIRLFSSWKGCFKRKKILFCCFLHDEYSYLTHDINTSENRFFTVSEIIKMVETVQIDRMINLGIALPYELRLWVANTLPSIWKIFCMKLPILTLDLNFFLFHFKYCFIIVTNKKRKEVVQIAVPYVTYKSYSLDLKKHCLTICLMLIFWPILIWNWGITWKNCLWLIKKLSVCLWAMNTIIILRTLVVIVIYGFLYLIVSGTSKR